MSNIQWKETGSSGASGSSSGSGPWFAVSMGLLGIIIGYGFAHAGSIKLPGGAPQVVQAPSQPTPAADQAAPTPPPAKDVPPVDPNKDHIRGNKNATVAVIEYSDFECPFCKRVHPTYEQIMTTYGDKVMWVYRHFPLSFHANAQKEAEASECVAELGGNDAFWKFADGIIEKTTSNGTGFPLDQLGPLAKSVGVDQTKFQTCLDSGKYATLVMQQENEGADAGVDGTPGNIVINVKSGKSQVISGAVPFASFQAAIDAMLKS